MKGTRAAAVAGHDRTSVEGERSVQVGGGERTEVQGEASWTVHDDLTVRADGSHTTIVGKPDAKRAWVLHVEGTTDLYGTGKTAIASKEGIRLSCGDSVIDVSPSRVEIVSPSIVLRSTSQGARIGVEDDTIQLFSKTDASVKSAHVVLATKDGAAVGLRKQVTASGQKFLLNSPDQAVPSARGAADTAHGDRARRRERAAPPRAAPSSSSSRTAPSGASCSTARGASRSRPRGEPPHPLPRAHRGPARLRAC